MEEYHSMGQAGILSEDDRVELLEGEVVQMSPIGKRHAACVNRLNRMLSEQVGQEAIVSVQNPIRVGVDSEPQPELALLRWRSDFYAGALAQTGTGRCCESAGASICRRSSSRPWTCR